MTDDQAIVQVEWRPLTRESVFNAEASLGSVTVARADDTLVDLGQLTRVDTARLVAHIFGGSATQSAGEDRLVKWIQPDVP